MCTKYHQMGRALGVAAGPDSVLCSRKPSRKKKQRCVLIPLKMSPTLMWYFTQGLMKSNVDRSTDRLTVQQINRQDDYCNPLAHAY